MGVPSVSMLSKEDVDAVHQASLIILNEVGVHLPLKKVLNLLKRRGAVVDYSRWNVKMLPDMVEEALKRAPKVVKLSARNPRLDLDLKAGNSYFGPACGANYVIDLDSGRRREGRLDDLDRLVRLCDGLCNVMFVGEVLEPQDAPVEVRSHYIWRTQLNNTSKHLQLYLRDARFVKDALKMASIVFGDEEKVAKEGFIDFTACIGQPLTFERSMLEGYVEAAKRGVPLVVNSGVMAGATGPATLAGSLALSNAEILAGIVLAESLNPGTPVIYSSWARIFDMKAATVSLASPEFVLLRICVGQMASYYGLPLQQAGFTVDSKIPDAQMGGELFIALISALAGTNLVVGMMLDGGRIVDYASIVIADEFAGHYQRILEGIHVSDRTLALDVMKEVGSGPGRSFIRTKHTYEHFKEEQWLQYSILERRNWSPWEKDGCRDLRSKALEKTQAILREHEPDPLPRDIGVELDRFVREARKTHVSRD